MAIPAEGWFLYAAGPGEEGRPGKLVRERYELADLEDGEILLAPLYGSFEANLGHAILRDPVDICRMRGLRKAVIGNGGVARVVRLGKEVRGLEEGQDVLFSANEPDAWGYPVRVMGYDSTTTGIMTTRMKLQSDKVIPIPESSDVPLSRWAAFSVRYQAAWANWRMAYGTFRLQVSEEELPRLNVWTWGGGTGLAEAHLAALLGHRAVAIASRSDRLELVERLGVEPVDRRQFIGLDFDPERYRTDDAWTAAYRGVERTFLDLVEERTGGQWVQIFVDMIGTPVFRATLRALGRCGVVTTAGWKCGMEVTYNRAIHSMRRLQLVHTHATRRRDALEAIAFALENDWFPEVDDPIATFDEIPELAARYLAGDFRMFPCYQVNPE